MLTYGGENPQLQHHGVERQLLAAVREDNREQPGHHRHLNQQLKDKVPSSEGTPQAGGSGVSKTPLKKTFLS